MAKLQRSGKQKVYLLLAIAAALGTAFSTAQSVGGNVRIAVNQRPPSLDWQFTTLESVRRVAIHVYENLLTVDEEGQVIPQLAEDFSVSDDGLTYTFTLRQGVPFHDGSVMTAEDVKSSLDRWLELGARRAELAVVEEVVVVDDHTVQLRLSAALPALPNVLAYPMAPPAIMPAAVAEGAAGGEVEVVGTGPYSLDSWVPDEYVRLVRFADYAADERFDGPTGFGGKRTAYFEVVELALVEEPGARVAGLRTGELDGAIAISPPNGRALANEASLRMVERPQAGKAWTMFNHAKWPSNDVRFRQAVLAALDLQRVMAIAGDGSFSTDPGLMFAGNAYFSTVGEDVYNQPDPERARELLAEMGYAGEEIVYVVPSDSAPSVKAGIEVEQQLEAVGINVRLDQYDFGTALGVRGDEDAWNLFQSSLVVEPTADPLPYASFFDSTRRWGFYGDEQMDVYARSLNMQATFEERFAALESMQRYMWETVAFLPLGNYGEYIGYQASIQSDLDLGFAIPRMWNTWRD